jgi:hypothetical protein
MRTTTLAIASWRSFMKSKSLASAVRVLSLLLLLSGTCALAQESTATADWQKPQSLVGTWRVQLTPVYCPGVTTGTLAKQFQGLVSFSSDRTLTNTFTNTLFGYDTPGHGYWWQTDYRTYKDVFEILIVDPPATSPYVPGTLKSFGAITLDDENKFTASIVAEYFNSSGTIYSTKCIDVVATRLNDSQTEP